MTLYNSRTGSSKDDWETPPELFEPLNRIFRFNLDVAADNSNTKCKKYLADALAEPWGLHRRIWCNPPFTLLEMEKW